MQIISQLMTAYTQVDQQIGKFQLKSGLRCLTGCGQCCPDAPVHVTMVEMFPAANEILLRGEGNLWIERIQALTEKSTCIFYSWKPAPDMPGHCTFYTWRPMVCRLFGFAAIRNRNGRKILSICKVLKEQKPMEAAAAVALQNEAPTFSEASGLIYEIEPGLGTRLLPINTALVKAIMALGLRIQIQQSESLGNNTAA